MPKPLLLQRPSGLYVRFLLPLDIRPRYGSRFIVRSLGGLRGDDARWRAACLGYALSQALSAVRQGDEDVDTKKLLDAALAAAADGSKWYEVTLPGGYTVKADSAADHRRAMEMVDKLGKVVAPGWGNAKSSRLTSAVPEPIGPMLHASIDRFLEQFGEKGRATATERETRHTLTLFRDLIDDVPMQSLGNDQVDRFRRCLSQWPARARLLPAFRGLSARAIVDKAKLHPDVPRLDVRTVDKHLDRLRVFFNDAVRRREVVNNPLAGVRLQTTDARYQAARRGFTADELRRLFDPELRQRHVDHDPMYFWLPVLMLYTGARMNELVYLDVADLDTVTNITGLHLVKSADGPMKTAQSKRYVPLPRIVMDMGLRSYAGDVAAAGFSQLFPGGSVTASNGRGDKLSKWFNRTYLRKACGILDPNVCLQSFRNTLLSRADRVGLSEAQMNPVVGHKSGSIQQRHYIDVPTLPERQRAIETLAASFDVPSLASYRRGQFDDYFKEMRSVQKRAAALRSRAERHARDESNKA